MDEPIKWYEEIWLWLIWNSAFGKWRRKIHCKLFGHLWHWNLNHKRFCYRCWRLIGDDEKGKELKGYRDE